MITASDNKNQTQYNYDNKNNLTNLTEPNGSSYTYSYDNKKNVTKASSSEGLVSTFQYNSFGQAKSTSVESNKYATSIEEGKTYRIRNKNSGKYITTTGTGNASNIEQSEFDNNDNKKWKIEKSEDGTFFIKSVLNNKSIDVSNNSNTNGTNIHLWDSANINAQKFKILPNDDVTFRILTKSSDFKSCVEVKNSVIDNGGNVQQWEFDKSFDTQKWYFEDVSIPVITSIVDGGIYQLRARHSGKYIDVANGNTAVGSKLWQYEQNLTFAQKFKINKQATTNFYTIAPMNAEDKLLSVSNELTSYDYEYIELANNTISIDKLFEFDYNATKNAFRIIPKLNNNKCLTIPFDSYENTKEFIAYSIGESDNNYFVLEKISDTMTSSAQFTENGNYVTSVTNASGQTATSDFNSVSGLLNSTSAGTLNTNYTYNPDKSLKSIGSSVLNPITNARDTRSLSYLYNDNGSLKSINRSLNSYNFEYDEFGNPKSTKIGSKTLSTNTYGAFNGNLIKSTYGNGKYIDFTYDALDRLTAKAYNGSSKKSTYSYNAFGQMDKFYDAMANKTTRYNYDFTGRPVSVLREDLDTGYGYDAYDRLITKSHTIKTPASTNTDTTKYNYGTKSYAAVPATKNLLNNIQLNGDIKLSYRYDNFLRPVKKTIDGANLFFMNYTYKSGAGNTTTPQLDTIGYGFFGSGLVEERLKYDYDEVGNITKIYKNNVLTTSYTYDSLNQLLREDNVGGYSILYTYDNNGNITYKKICPYNQTQGAPIDAYTYSYTDANWSDKLSTFNGQTITYDAIGNPLSYRGAALTWDNGRQLQSFVKGATNETYTYNEDGMRTSKKNSDGITINYINDGSKILGEYKGTDTSNITYYYYDENDQVYAIKYDGEMYYYVRNATNDIIKIVDRSGTVVVNYKYNDAYGEKVETTGSMANSLGYDNPFRYKGYYFDNDTRLYYLQSRYYDPMTCRFINADGVTSTGETSLAHNMYAYCYNTPVNMADYNGQIPEWLVWTIKKYIKLNTYNPAFQFDKSVIYLASNATLDILDWNVTRLMFNHAIYGNGASIPVEIRIAISNALEKSGSLIKQIDISIGKSNNKFFSFYESFTFDDEKDEDLAYSIHGVGMISIIGMHRGGVWNIYVEFEDTYDFPPYNSGTSMADIANKLGYTMQVLDMLTPYKIHIYHGYEY